MTTAKRTNEGGNVIPPELWPAFKRLHDAGGGKMCRTCGRDVLLTEMTAEERAEFFTRSVQCAACKAVAGE